MCWLASQIPKARIDPALRRMLLGATLLLAATSAGAQAAAVTDPDRAAGPAISYALDAGHTRVHWEVVHLGTSTTRGRFDKLSGSVTFDARRQLVDVGITAQTDSVSTGMPAFDKIMRGKNLLSSEAYPQAYFTARKATWDGPQLLELNGEITLRGISRPLRLKALRFKCGFNPLFRREVCGGDFEAFFKRSDFNMTLALPLVADDVRLLVQVEAVRNE